jgi:hypothetical protein
MCWLIQTALLRILLIYKFYCGKVELTKEDTKSEE